MKRENNTSTKDPIVVVRRTRKQTKNKTTKLSSVTRQATTAGIPSFAIRRHSSDDDDDDDKNDDNYVAPTTATAAGLKEVPDYRNEDQDDEEIVPSDAYFAMVSLQQESRGLHVPLLGGGGDGPNDIQLVLEYQILQRLSQTNPSETWKELRDMLRQNTLRAFSMTIVTTTSSKNHTKHPSHSSTITRRVAYMEATSHIQGVWNAHHYHSHSNPEYTWVVEWFLEEFLPQHGTTKPWILASELEHEWRGARPHSSGDGSSGSSTTTTTTATSLEEAIRYLMTIQVLRRETAMSTKAEESYSLWLPNLGVLLKAWNEARQQVVGLLQRAPGKEVSQRNLLQKNRHASISTPFILQDLQEQGLIQHVERPFGTFIKLS